MSITERAIARIEAIAGRVVALASQYVDSFDPLFASLAGIYIHEYANFEREVSNDVEPLLAVVEKATTEFPNEARDKFVAAEASARDRLKADLKAAHLASRQDAEERSVELEQLEKHEPRLIKEVDRVRIAMAGTERAKINIKLHTGARWAAEIVLLIATAAAIGGVETLIGFSVWDFATNADMALGLTIVTIVVPTILVHFVAVYQRRYHAYKDAEKTFRTRNKGEQHTDGFEVDPFPAAEKLMATWGLLTLIGIGMALLGLRVGLVLLGGQNMAGTIGAAVIIVILLVSGLILFGFAAPYTPHQYKALAQAEEDLNILQARLRNLRMPEEGVYRQQADEAEAAYMAQIEQARQNTQDDLEAIEAKRLALVAKLHQCDEAFGLFVQGFRESSNRLIRHATISSGLDGTQHPFGASAEDARIMRLFSDHVTRKYHKPELVERLQRHQFTVDFDDPSLTEFKTIEGEVKKSAAIRQIGIAGPDAPVV